MKKLIAILLVALVAVVLVACGGNDSTTPATTTAGNNTQTTTPAEGDTTTPAEGDITTTPDADVTTKEPLYATGEDIMYGDPAYMAVDPFWNQGVWPCKFENHHAPLGYNWCLVFKMLPTDEFVIEQLIAVDPETNTGTLVNAFAWTLVINEEEIEIDSYYISPPNGDTSGALYVRLDLGADWTFPEGENDYDIKLKITEDGTDEVMFWAYFTDPTIGGVYTFEAPKPIEMVPAEKPNGVVALPSGSLEGTAGPAGMNASETYVNLFDGEVRTKLCTADMDNDIIFMISDNITTFNIKGLSFVGANDDEKFNERVISKFTVYGANSGEADASWEKLVTVDKSSDFGTITNYGEYYYAFDEDSSYKFYKIEIENEAGKYQFSEVILYAEENSVTAQ